MLLNSVLCIVLASASAIWVKLLMLMVMLSSNQCSRHRSQSCSPGGRLRYLTWYVRSVPVDRKDSPGVIWALFTYNWLSMRTQCHVFSSKTLLQEQ